VGVLPAQRVGTDRYRGNQLRGRLPEVMTNVMIHSLPPEVMTNVVSHGSYF